MGAIGNEALSPEGRLLTGRAVIPVATTWIDAVHIRRRLAAVRANELVVGSAGNANITIGRYLDQLATRLLREVVPEPDHLTDDHQRIITATWEPAPPRTPPSTARAGVAGLLRALQEAGAEQQARTLGNRVPAEGAFDLFREQPEHVTRYRFGRELNGSPAPSWDRDDLN